jgi:hypothetical protein
VTSTHNLRGMNLQLLHSENGFYAILTVQADADSNQQTASSKIRHATHSATRLGKLKDYHHRESNQGPTGHTHCSPGRGPDCWTSGGHHEIPEYYCLSHVKKNKKKKHLNTHHIRLWPYQTVYKIPTILNSLIKLTFEVKFMINYLLLR